MALNLRTNYTYKISGGEQHFIIEINQEGRDYVGIGLTEDGKPITGRVRISFETEEDAKIDAIDSIISAVQGLIIGLIHKHSTNPYLKGR